jgi:hypothetical protein
MAAVNPNTGNVKLGVCRVFFGNEDLGYTKGGVEVEVTTNTSKISVDQFGDTEIDEIIRGRMIRVKAPFAESTLKNLNRLFPASSFVETGGAAATGTVTIATNPAANDTIFINGVTFTFVASVTGPNQVLIGGSANATALNLSTAINASPSREVMPVIASATGASAICTLTYKGKTTEGNAFTLLTGTAGVKVTMSGATLSGGSNPTAGRVDVVIGVGTSLIANSKELRLHPIEKADTDLSEDLIIPKASTPGQISYAYKLDEERVFMAEFRGYPDQAQNFKLFSIGSPYAV